MALVLADRVRDTTTTTGTGTVTLSGTAPTGYQNFSVIGNGNTTYYTINAGSQWEVGIGTYSSTGPTLSRDTVLSSSNSGSLVNFSAGTKDVFVTYPSGKSVYQDGSAIKAGSAILAVPNGGTGQTTYTDGQLLIGNTTGNTLTKSTLTAGSGVTITNGAGSITISATGSGGTVTSVAASGGTTGLTFSGSPITTSGTLTLGGTLAVANGGTGQTTYTDGQLLIGNTTGNTLTKATLTAGSGVSITNGSGSITISATGSGGTVTSVSFTGGIVSVANPTTTPAFTVAGTSGGIPYFTSASTWASSAVLAANSIVIGGGAGVAPSTTTTGTGVLTALGVNTGTAGAFVVNGGALGTPSSGTVTNLTGTASININGTVGATTPTTGAFTTVTASTSATVPLISGGSAAASNLTIQSTSGAGTTDYIAFRTASQAERMRIGTNGGVAIGGTGTDASLHIQTSYGGFDRLTQMSPSAASKNAFNIMAAKNASSVDLWWSWGVDTSNRWRINQGVGFSTNGIILDDVGQITSADQAAAFGYKGIPQNAQTASYTLALSDMGKHISITTGGVVIPANASVAFPIGSAVTIFNNSGSNQTISITTDTLRQAGTANTGSRTLAQYGVATCLKVASTVWVISGAGVS